MNTKSRIKSILKTNCLDTSITGLPTFDLAELDLQTDLDFQLPTNLRLGHLAETIVAQLLKAATNYKVLYENVQLFEDKKTIGEIDFILKNKETEQLIHMELAYKFYLYDPKISSEPINNWIGPNRNDSLSLKLAKVKEKQFPLLYQDAAKAVLSEVEVNDISQALCLLVNLFVPFEFNERVPPIYEKAIKGFYLNFEKFISSDHSDKKYYLPPKLEWGMDPAENDSWTDFSGIKEFLAIYIQDEKAPLCWQKQDESYVAFFVVWW